jgi:hypothetical protein
LRRISPADFPEDKKATRALFAEERAALRELFSLPAVYSDDVWHKVQVFETELLEEQVIGRSTDSIVSIALGRAFFRIRTPGCSPFVNSTPPSSNAH